MSEWMPVEQALLDALAELRAHRDALPTRPAIECYCGNLGGTHSNVRCGRPCEVWGDDAWRVEYLARDLERAALTARVGLTQERLSAIRAESGDTRMARP